MNKEKRRVPELRFPGFTEDWEQRKLGDYLSIPEKEVLEVASSDDLITVKLNLGGVELGASRDTLSLGSTVYYKRYAGQFIYGKQNFFNGSMGLIPTNLDGKGSSGDVPSFNVSNIEENYLYTYVSRESYWRSKVAAASGTGSKRIHEKTFLDFNIDVPSMDEQKLISNIFDLIDRFITLHQRKLEHLNLKKKALLQKLFPKNGDRYPELRFPGFTDAWEQRKLDDIAKIKTGGGTPKTANPEYWSGNIPWIQSSDLVEGDIVHVNINKFINNNALKNSAAKLISRDSIALVTRVGVGKVAVINQDFTTSQDFLSLSDFDGNDIKFLAYQLYRLMQENAKVLQGTSIKGITKTELIEQSISIPSSSQEQNLISNVLSKIDSIITLHQRKLDHLQLQKKALLQQMFV